MALRALGPCFDRIGNMIAQESAPGIMTEEFRCTVGLPGDVDSPQSIKGRTVPEGRTALFGEEAVFGHQLFSEQRPNSPFAAVLQPGDQRHAYPRAEFRTAIEIAVSFVSGNRGAEMAFNRLSELRSLPFVNSQRFTRTSELLSEIDGRPQGIIIECRCTEIGLAGRESALQFIGIGSDDPFGSEFAPAVFETPFHQRPQLFGFVPFPAGQGVARSAYAIIAASPRSPAPFQMSSPSAMIELGIGRYSAFMKRAKWRNALSADRFPMSYPSIGKKGLTYSA